MTIIEQIQEISSALQAWVAENGGTIREAADPQGVITMLANKPGGFLAIVTCDGEDKSGEYEEAGWVDRRFSVILSRGKSLDITGSSKMDSRGNSTPFFDLIETCRDLLRGMGWEHETVAGITNYKGWKQYEIEGQKLFDAIQIDFTVNTALPGDNDE